MRAALALTAAMGLVGLTAAGCGQENGVVGGVCIPGFTECTLQCVDLNVDNNNCGQCGHVCPAATQCTGGVCVGGDGATSDGGRKDGSSDGSDDVNALDVNDERPFCDASDPCRKECRPPTNVVCTDGGEGGTDGSNDGNGGDGSNDGNGGDGSDDGSGGDGSNDGSGGDGSDDGSGGDGSNGDGSSGDGSITDGGPPTDACTPPYNSAAHCGACNNACVAPNDVCALVNGNYQCAPLCAPPLTNCGGRCVNLLRDPYNCGQCNNVCPSRICVLATCQGTVAGNVVVIGHDYLTSSAASQQSKILNNAVFYNNSSFNKNVRIFSYEHYVNPVEVAAVKSIIDSYAQALSYTVAYTVSVSDTDVANGSVTPATQDVLLVYDQPNAPAGKLATVGASWAARMSAFTIGGGIIIVLDGGQGTGEMPQFETSAALLSVTSHALVPDGTAVNVAVVSDAVARGMTSVYATDDNTVRFFTVEPQTSKLFYVIVDPSSGQPIVVHKIVN
jgi:hypothetical protein